jgi:hypothetical protein
MNVSAVLVANPQPARSMELTKRLLNDPTPAVKTFAGLHAVPGETWQRQFSPDPKRPGRIRGASEVPPRGRSANASLHGFVELTPVGHAVTPPDLTHRYPKGFQSRARTESR